MILNIWVNLILKVILVFFLVIPLSKAYRVFNMRTQTIMESANVVINDSCDFSEFSKEDTISSLIEDMGDETATDQPVVTPSKTRFGPSKSVATAATPETGTVKPIAIETV